MGTWHTPEQFVNRALHSPHPMEENALHQITKDAIEFVAKSPAKLVSIERKKNLLKANIMAKQLEGQEKELHANLPTSIRKVVHDKKIFLWEKLPEQNNYDDMKVVHFMKEGVPLVGTHDHPSCYAMKLKLASTTEELRDSAVPSRLALEARKPQTDSPGFAEHLEFTAQEEVHLSFLEGPFHSAEEVTNLLGHSSWRIMRRFVIEQGAKLRPIDDGLESRGSTKFCVHFHDQTRSARCGLCCSYGIGVGKHRGLSWVGKTLDLSKAYKQLSIRPEHRDLAVVFFRDSQGKPKYYVPNALMFGSTATVYAFNRVSRSIWFLVNVVLKVPSAVYFDDYPMFSPEESSQDTDALVSDFLDLLGWRHDRTGPKGKPFSPSFDVLGMTLDLGNLESTGHLTLKNKEGRVEKIASKYFRSSRKAKCLSQRHKRSMDC